MAARNALLKYFTCKCALGISNLPNPYTIQCFDIECEEIDRAIALSLAEEEEKNALANSSSDDDQTAPPLQAHSDEDRKGKQVIDNESYLEEDEQVAKALQESLNVESPPRHDNGSIFLPFPFVFPTGYRKQLSIISPAINRDRAM